MYVGITLYLHQGRKDEKKRYITYSSLISKSRDMIEIKSGVNGWVNKLTNICQSLVSESCKRERMY